MNWTGERGGYSRWGKQEINSTSPHSKTITQPLNFSCCSDHGAFCAFRSQRAWHGALGQRWSCSAGQAETVPAVTSYFLHLKHDLSFPVLQGKYPSQNHGLDSAIQAQHLHTPLGTDFRPIHWSSAPAIPPPAAPQTFLFAFRLFFHPLQLVIPALPRALGSSHTHSPFYFFLKAI